MTDAAAIDHARCSRIERLMLSLGGRGLHDALTPEERAVLPFCSGAWRRPSVRLPPPAPPKREPGFGRWSGQQEPPGRWLFSIACGGRGMGKALALDTKIPTPTGWTTMGEIREGDEVFAEDGSVCRVTGVFDSNPTAAYHLTFSDGTTLDACSDHQWVTWTHAERKSFLRSQHEDDVTRFPADWPAWRVKARIGGRRLKKEFVEDALRRIADGQSIRKVAGELGVGQQTLVQYRDAGGGIEPTVVVDPEGTGPRMRTTEDIARTLTYGARGDLNHCIPVCSALQLPDAPLPIDPYALGAWLGDGTSRSAEITIGDEDSGEIICLLEDVGVRVNRSTARRTGTGYALRYGLGQQSFHGASCEIIEMCRANGALRQPGNSLRSQLGRMGLLNKKRVPQAYLRGSAAQRLFLLQGLMDTDGTGADGKVEFTNTNRALADAVVELARSLGQKPVLSEGRATLYGRDIGPKYRVTWRATIPVFRLHRKAARLTFGGPQSLRNHHRMIVAADPIAPKPMRCISVDSRNHMYLAGEGMIPTHNSWLLTHFILERARRFPGCRIAAVARTANAMWSEIVEGKAGLLAFSPKWFAPRVQANKRQLVYPNGSLVKLFTAEEPDTLRGPNNDFGAVDELCAMKYAEEMWRQLQMTMRSGVHPQTMVATTPRPLKLLMRLVEDPRSAVTIGRSYENRANVAQSWLDENVKPYVGTTFGRQEVDGEILDEMPGALFERKWFDRDTWCPDWRKDSKFRRIGVGVDPAETSGEHADNWGIIAVGQREDGLIEVLEDATVNATPDVAAKAAVDCYWRHGASFMVADVGRSGQLVDSVIRLTDRRVRVLRKGGNKGKRAWAEGAAVLYAKHLVFHAPGLEKLEDECCRWTDDVPQTEWSPDRMDALAYVLAELSLKGAPPTVSRPVEERGSDRDFVRSGARDLLRGGPRDFIGGSARAGRWF